MTEADTISVLEILADACPVVVKIDLVSVLLVVILTLAFRVLVCILYYY